jgi:hypothetical protein
MAAKPTDTTDWTGGTAIEPSAGKKAVGFLAGERPAAEHLQWLLERHEAWLRYLEDGAFAGPHTFGSTVGVTGLITATAGLTAAANQHITVSGTGEIKHGDRVKTVGLSNAYYSGSVSWDDGNVEAAASAAGFLSVEIPFEVGDRVKTATARAHGNAATTVTVAIEVLDGSGSAAQVTNGGQVLSAAYQTTTPTASSGVTLTANHSVRAVITFSAGGSAAQSVAVVFDHP